MAKEIPGTQSPERREMLRQALEAIEKLQKKLEASEQARREPIAVIGMGCRFPGGVKTPEQYWDLLIEGRDAITRMPEDRWAVAASLVSDTAGPSDTQPPWGGFLENIDHFDAGFFGISRREAESMDPQQRLLLEVSWEAIERAGIDASTLRGSRTGVFVGVTTTDYSHIALNQDPALLDAYTATGSALNVTAGRIAFVLGLNGPAMAVDTACSSSLVALHLACQSLRLGESDMALAGGVNALLKPEPFICFAKWGMMAPDGRCKTFDAAADGFVRSEGCGVLVLKRLADALSAGDNILALIRGSAVNQDGASSGLTVPNGRAQEAVITQALKAAMLSSSQIGYVEAHGTGTKLGDPIELEAIVNVLCAGRSAADSLRVGSVKTNLGHLESASGVAGLIKVILSLKHEAIPPHIHFKALSPQVSIGKAPVEVPKETVLWVRSSKARIAGVSSFGFSGTNAHLIVEEAPAHDQSPPREREAEIICLSARSRTALQQKARDLVGFLNHEPGFCLPEVSYALSAGRKHFSHRLALSCRDVRSMRQELQEWLDGKNPRSVLNAESIDGTARKVAYLFSGQGAQYPGMGKTLYETQPVFRQAVDRCAEILKPLIDRPLGAILFDPEESGRTVHETVYTQPALFAIEYALFEMLRDWGIRPSVVMGHSVGEYVAACVAGVFGLDDGLKLIVARSQLMVERTERGRMVAIFADERTATSAIAGFERELSIAALNGPENVVISGRVSAMEKVLEELSRKSVRYTELHVSHAFHSPLMEPMLPAFYREASKASFSPAGITWISNVDGQPFSQGAAPDADYWCRHVRQAVRFESSIRSLVAEGCDCWLEIGPHPVLLSMARQIVPDSDALMLPTLRRQQPDWATLTNSLAGLYSRGWDIKWKAFHAGRSIPAVQLPTYPFEREAFWISAEGKAPSAWVLPQVAGPSSHPLLGSRVDIPLSEGIFIWQTSLDLQRCSFLLDHCIQGSAIFPATAYIEMAFAATAETQPHKAYALRDLSFHKPLHLTRESRSILQLWMRKGPDGSFETRVFSRNASIDDREDGTAAWTLHMTGAMALRATEHESVEGFDLSSIRSRCQEEVAGTAFYEGQAKRGNQWGPCFQGVHALWRGNGEALSEIRIPPQLYGELGDYLFHPAVADFCGHVLTATLPAEDAGQRAGAFVGGGIGDVRVYGTPAGRRLWSHARLRQDIQTADNVLVGDVRLWDEAGNLVSETLGAQLWYLDRQPSAGAADIRRWLHEIAWVPDGSDSGGCQIDLSGQRWAIFEDNKGVGEALQHLINSCGGTACMVRRGDTYQRESESCWRIRPAIGDDFRNCLMDVCADSRQTLNRVVYLWHLDAPALDGLTAEKLRDWQLIGCGSALNVLRAMAGIEQTKTARLFLVTSGAQASPGLKGSLSPVQAVLWGLGRTAAIEHAQLWGGLVDLDPAASWESSALHLVQAIAIHGTEDQAILRDGRRLVARLCPLKMDASNDRSFKIHRDGSYLITGGLGGIGFETACWLGQKGVRHLLLLGRTELPERGMWDHANGKSPLKRRIERIRELERLGLQVTYFRGDASDARVFAEIRRELAAGRVPPLKGIIHAAGVMQYEPLANQSAERMLEVMQAKVIGSWLLHRSFLDQTIELFVMYSSTSSILNSPFMGAYAAANTFLDAMAAYRRREGLPALSVSWGTWSETGMAVDDERATGSPRSMLKGVGTLSNRDGLDALELLLRNDAVHAGVMPMDWEEWRRAYPAFSAMPFFRELMESIDSSPAAESWDAQFGKHGAQAAKSVVEADNVTAYLTGEIAKVLKTQPQKVPLTVPLPSLGFDSLMAVEIKNRIQTDLRLDMPVVKLIEGQTITQLSDFISMKLRADWAAGDSTQMTADGNKNEMSQGEQGWEEGAL